MKNKKGITLIALVITVVVLLILASIGTYSGINIIKSSQLTAFTTELKIMQTQVNRIYQEKEENQEYGKEITGEVEVQARKVFTEGESGITSYNGYSYWDTETIRNLKIEGVEQNFFVNLETRSIVSYEGFKYEDKIYYTLEQLPNGLYNVEYEESNSNVPTFDASIESTGTGKWKVDISNIKYEGYIDKWQVQYRREEKSYWNTTEDMSFVVRQKGIYYVTIGNGQIKSEEKIICIIDEENVKITKDKEGKRPANTQIEGTNTYININITDNPKYTITSDPALPLQINKNGKYVFNINITDENGKTGVLENFEVIVDLYVKEPPYWINFAGTSHIELNDINQNDLYQQYTIATKIKVEQQQQTSKKYMGLWGNHYANEGIAFQFHSNTTTLLDGEIDYTPYYGKWTDLVKAYNKTTREIKIYIDGELKGTRNNIDTFPYSGFNIGTSFLVKGYDRQMIGQMTSLKIWDKELTAEEVDNIDLFKEDVEVRKEDIYANINLKSEAEINKIGTFIGTGHSFK